MPTINFPPLVTVPSKETLLVPLPSPFIINVISISLLTVKVELEPNVILAEVPLPAFALNIFIFSLAEDETTIGKSITNFFVRFPLTRISVVLFPEKVRTLLLVAVIVVTEPRAALVPSLICPNVTFTSIIGFPLLITTFAFLAVGFPFDQLAALDQRLSPPPLLKYFWPKAEDETNKKVSMRNKFFIITMWVLL